MQEIEGLVRLKDVELRKNEDTNSIDVITRLEMLSKKMKGEIFTMRNKLAMSLFVFTKEEWRQMGADREDD